MNMELPEEREEKEEEKPKQRSQNNGILMDIESEMAGEIEAPSQPFPRRHNKVSSTNICKLAEMINC